MRLPFVALALVLTACTRPLPPGQVRVRLEREGALAVGLFGPDGKVVAQPVAGGYFQPGPVMIDCGPGAPPGTWQWRALAYAGTNPRPVGALAAGVATRPGEIAGGELGPPMAVAADDSGVFLGWRGARTGHEVVAVETDGRVRWGYHRGPDATGVTALAAEGGLVFVLDGGVLYKLDAQTGRRVPFGERAELVLATLWAADARVQPTRGDALAADRGRVYITFAEEGFIAALDAASGAYVITLSAPGPGQLALSETPVRDPETGAERPVDFGIAAIAGHGLAYFLMEHEPAWVMGSVTRWLQPEEKIVALTAQGDTMRSDKVTIYTALGAPHHQVQLRPADAVEGFAVAVGQPGGRPAEGPWESGALRDIRALAVDGAGQLWIAEGDERFGRFSVWRTEGKVGRLVREIFGPLPAADFSPDPADPQVFFLGGHRWRLDPTAARATPEALFVASPSGPALEAQARTADGLTLWAPGGRAGEPTAFSRSTDGRHWGYAIGDFGVHVFALPGLEEARPIGSGRVTIPAP